MKIGGGAKVDGNGNIAAGRDITVIATATYGLPPSRSDFSHLDEIFRSQVSSEQIVMRYDKAQTFSAEGLFTSLMRIGVPYNGAMEATERVINLLADWKDESSDPHWKPTTIAIRTAVMRIFSAFGDDKKHDREQIGLWLAAYVRRYGNPSMDCMKVIDHDAFVDLDYEYISETILPHLLSRIVGLDRTENPLERFSEGVFSRQNRDQMARAIMNYTRVLNVYSIRYKTLINLLQDLVLEPPHPWIVNGSTLHRITAYNVDRAEAHFKDITEGGKDYGFEFSAKECMQHICAAVLSKYGAFLGIDHKYGVFELRRILSLKHTNPDLWDSCQLAELEPDMRRIGVDPVMFKRLLESVRQLWHTPPREDTNERLMDSAANLMKMCTPLLSDYLCEPMANG